ncbi:hypothetical protein COCCADRAFT_96194, partial [Bipolaris zeicola 26-R-13]
VISAPFSFSNPLTLSFFKKKTPFFLVFVPDSLSSLKRFIFPLPPRHPGIIDPATKIRRRFGPLPKKKESTPTRRLFVLHWSIAPERKKEPPQCCQLLEEEKEEGSSFHDDATRTERTIES